MLNLDETVLIECIFLRSEKEALDPLPAPMAGRWRAAGRFVNVMLDEQACARGGGAVSGDQRRALCVHEDGPRRAPLLLSYR